MGVAVMDIGSNSVRLLLWREDGREQLLETTRLGEGAAHGRLTEGGDGAHGAGHRRLCKQGPGGGPAPVRLRHLGRAGRGRTPERCWRG